MRIIIIKMMQSASIYRLFGGSPCCIGPATTVMPTHTHITEIGITVKRKKAIN